ncbi:MAG TPA: protein-glutamate O-methyltransferase CheR [Patescibacteria group bacterium]|nr:protein-glutamate O-methyltransferase CheR [Patescibacteria group bacterium]
MKFPSGSGTTPNTSKSPTLSQLTFQNIREAIYRQTGIYYTDNKKNQLEQTIAKRLLRLNLASFEKYLELIESPAQKSLKSKEIFNAMAVQDSSFFSSQEQITVVKDIVIPDILKKKQNNNLKLKIWSAATSTGEEAYSLAIVMLEYVLPKFSGLAFEIIASDISQESLEVARAGRYEQRSLSNLPQILIQKYFSLKDGKYEINDDVKKLVSFSTVNVIDAEEMKSFKDIDLAFCTNVLMFFDPPGKQKVIAHLYESLNRNGYLFIGYSESLHGVPKAFKLVHLPKAMAYKKE